MSRQELERLARKIAQGDRSLSTAEAYAACVRSLQAGFGSSEWVEFKTSDEGELENVLRREDWPAEFPGDWISTPAASLLHSRIPFSREADVTLRYVSTNVDAGAFGARYTYSLEARPRRTAKVVEVSVASKQGRVWRLRGTFDRRDVKVITRLNGDKWQFVEHAPVSLSNEGGRVLGRGHYEERYDPESDGIMSTVVWDSGAATSGWFDEDLLRQLVDSKEWQEAAHDCVARAEEARGGK